MTEAMWVALIAFASLFGLMALRIPIGVALVAIALVGLSWKLGFDSAYRLVALTASRTITDYNFAVIPLFVVMGVLARESGISKELFQACSLWFGRARGGVALSSIAASAGFAAISGSSVASAATMSRIAMPEMQSRGYEPGYAAGAIAAGGTLGILIPPSVPLILYGILTDNDIARLFMAGLLPGILAVFMYLGVVMMLSRWRPGYFPRGDAATWGAKVRGLRGVLPALGIFAFVIGGIYAGLFTVVEAAGMGAAATLVAAALRRSLGWRQLKGSFAESARISATLFLILIGAMVFGNFLVMTGAPQQLTATITDLPLSPFGILLVLLLAYLILGCFLDAVAMIIITIPIVYPVITQLGFDPIWFGIIMVMVCELGMITPPYGINVFVINGVVRDVSLTQMFRGVLPFVGIDIVRVGIVLAFPAIALLLPRAM